MPENPPNSGSRHPQKDRRLHARQRIHSLSYAKIGDGNGGIVLNISEGGISVQAAGVLDDSETVPMWLEIPRLRERVEVTGEIVWLSPSKKEAGLRFVDLSESALREIRKWMAQEAAPKKFEDETDPVNEEQDVSVQTIEQHETLTLEPLEEDIAVEDDEQELESPPESIEEFATNEDEEQEAEIRQEARVETETGIDEKPEIEDVPVTRAGTDLSAADPATSAERSETGDRAEEESEAEEKRESEDDLIKSFGPPVVPFERRPQAPFWSMSASSGASRGPQNLAIAPAIAHTIPQALAEEPAPPVSDAPSDWKDFRVQLQTGWFLAALILLLALISFIAGMAVRRGVLNGVMGEQEDVQAPKSAPPPDASVPSTNSSGNAAANVGATPANPLSIEIVDMGNRRWVIPASTGANHENTATPGASENPASAVSTTPGPEGDHAAPSGVDLHAQGLHRPGGSLSSSAPTSPTKPNVPLVLSLPETPISASGSVAISAQRSVPVPPDGSQSGKSPRNLQVGQLVNLVEPAYPPEAVQQKIEGIVKLHAVIGTDGVIESLAQVSGPQILVNASMAAVRNWKYSPTRMNGQAVETQEDISFVFRLPK
jgi:outer membrane biosynthesis protein TonB/Tfp pilus assembly protein PilZ